MESRIDPRVYHVGDVAHCPSDAAATTVACCCFLKGQPAYRPVNLGPRLVGEKDKLVTPDAHIAYSIIQLRSRIKSVGYYPLRSDALQNDVHSLVWTQARVIDPETRACKLLAHHPVKVSPDMTDVLFRSCGISGKRYLQRRGEHDQCQRPGVNQGNVFLQPLPINDNIIDYGGDARLEKAIGDERHVPSPHVQLA